MYLECLPCWYKILAYVLDFINVKNAYLLVGSSFSLNISWLNNTTEGINVYEYSMCVLVLYEPDYKPSSYSLSLSRLSWQCVLSDLPYSVPSWHFPEFAHTAPWQADQWSQNVVSLVSCYSQYAVRLNTACIDTRDWRRTRHSELNSLKCCKIKGIIPFLKECLFE